MKTVFVSRKDFPIPDASMILLQDHNIEIIREYLVRNGFKWFLSSDDDGPLKTSKNFEVGCIIFVDQDDKTITKYSKKELDHMIYNDEVLSLSWDDILDLTYIEF